MRKKGFSLIELLVVIAITAVLLLIGIVNYLGARSRARDSRRKTEMKSVKDALRMYYNDYQKYPPAGVNCGSGKVNYISGCKADGATCCPCDAALALEFAASGSGCDVVYMKKFPSELGTSMYYYQVANGDDFRLKVPLENRSDPDIATSKARCPSLYCAGIADYCVCAD